jgi:hypothetical protein
MRVRFSLLPWRVAAAIDRTSRFCRFCDRFRARPPWPGRPAPRSTFVLPNGGVTGTLSICYVFLGGSIRHVVLSLRPRLLNGGHIANSEPDPDVHSIRRSGDGLYELRSPNEVDPRRALQGRQLTAPTANLSLRLVRKRRELPGSQLAVRQQGQTRHGRLANL